MSKYATLKSFGFDPEEFYNRGSGAQDRMLMATPPSFGKEYVTFSGKYVIKNETTKQVMENESADDRSQH